MPSYFFKCTKKGIILTSEKITNKLQLWEGPEVITQFDIPMGLDLDGKSNEEFMKWVQFPEIKFGFAIIENPLDLDLKFGDEVPLVITEMKCNQAYFPEYPNICWATPE